MMTKQIVFVDIDDTTYNFNTLCSLVALNEFGVRVNTTPEDWASFMLEDLSVCIPIFERCHDRDHIFLSKPFPGAVDALQRIEELGYDIRYLSDRKSSSLEDTRDWLIANGFPNTAALTVGADKRKHMEQFKGQIAAVFDDRPRTLIFARYDLEVDNVFSLRFSYNCNLTDIPGVHLRDEWPELLKDFETIFCK